MDVGTLKRDWYTVSLEYHKDLPGYFEGQGFYIAKIHGSKRSFETRTHFSKVEVLETYGTCFDVSKLRFPQSRPHLPIEKLCHCDRVHNGIQWSLDLEFVREGQYYIAHIAKERRPDEHKFRFIYRSQVKQRLGKFFDLKRVDWLDLP